MSVDTQSASPDRVPCQVCQHDIPLSEAVVAEATDYVVYFCGLDCYERWRASNAAFDSSLPKRGP
jgi:Domain of unknown function (DUF3330)